ncbi:hypothetical protein Clacol_001347 [Clathrus columnatus]|uniref:Uncharacterized protein n=1 Tax=Clathrus columnatus TaxID=1419009 RepID=A0AAV5A0N8_9AGAM|nr:hypothetical protein Clacol_001347 [Clathrus columnatus]
MPLISKPQRDPGRAKGFTKKLLPYTPYVSSWPYRTDILSIERWEKHPVTHTWEKEVEEWKNDGTQGIAELIRDVAKMVDILEENIHKHRALRRTCGFNKKGKSHTHQLHSWQTHHEDMLLWAFDGNNPSIRTLTFQAHHPELALRPWSPAPDAVKRFSELTQSKYPSYYPIDELPTATLSLAVESDDGETPRDAVGEVNHPSTWGDGDIFLAHAGTNVNAMNSKAVSRMSVVSCNLWLLISSLIYLIKMNDTTYCKRFATAYKYMDVDSRAKKTIEEYLAYEEAQEESGTGGEEKGDKKKGRKTKKEKEGKIKNKNLENKVANKDRSSARVLLAMAGLCHSSMFVLDPSLDLSEEQPPYHDLPLTGILLVI